MEDRNATPSPTKSRLRFSLGTFFVGAIVLTLIASNLFTSWHLQNARQVNRAQQMELEFLRKELRFLDTSDQDHVHIVALETHQDMVWKWRVYVPDGKKFWLKSVIGKITDRGFPHDEVYTSIGPGEIVLTCSVARNAAGEWEQAISQDFDGHGSAGTEKIPEASLHWYGKRGSSTTSGSITPSLKQQSYSGNDRIELLRLRKWVHENPNQTFDPYEPTDGILFWLEPAEEEDVVSH